MVADSERFALLRMALTPGLGPARTGALLARFGSAVAAVQASPAELAEIRGIGGVLAGSLGVGLADSERAAEAELSRLERSGAVWLTVLDREYPTLLRELPDAPTVLYCRGSVGRDGVDGMTIAIVGSRRCTAYGIEQASRFAGVLAQSGLTIVSGGARGIDAAAHRGALEAAGRTIVVSGCGLGHVYPPEHGAMFDRVCERGAVISELPFDTPPRAENFPARNRIVSGLSLGVLVIEAGRRSGALITARLAVEEHGREVMALPGRADSEACRGSLELLRSGGAAMVIEPADVLNAIESAAGHQHRGTHDARYAPASSDGAPWRLDTSSGRPENGDGPSGAIVRALRAEPLTMDGLVAATGASPDSVRAELTLLEIRQRVRRAGSRFELSRPK